jgi:hypothetical protein
MSEYRVPERGRSPAVEALADRARRGDHEIELRAHVLPAREKDRRLALAAGAADREGVARLSSLLGWLGIIAFISAVVRRSARASSLASCS